MRDITLCISFVKKLHPSKRAALANSCIARVLRVSSRAYSRTQRCRSLAKNQTEDALPPVLLYQMRIGRARTRQTQSAFAAAVGGSLLIFDVRGLATVPCCRRTARTALEARTPQQKLWPDARRVQAYEAHGAADQRRTLAQRHRLL